MNIRIRAVQLRTVTSGWPVGREPAGSSAGRWSMVDGRAHRSRVPERAPGPSDLSDGTDRALWRGGNRSGNHGADRGERGAAACSRLSSDASRSSGTRRSMTRATSLLHCFLRFCLPRSSLRRPTNRFQKEGASAVTLIGWKLRASGVSSLFRTRATVTLWSIASMSCRL